MDEKQEVSLPVALLMLVGVVAVFIGLQNKDFLMSNYNSYKMVATVLKNYLLVYCGLIFINSILGVHYLRRIIGLSKQGSRLRAIKKKPHDRKWIISQSIILLGSGITLGVILKDYLLSGITIKGIGEFDFYQSSFFITNVGFLFWFISKKIFFLLGLLVRKGKIDSLPKFPDKKDHIVLGSVNEESENEPSEWETTNRKGLNGSVLITGSVGSGKTAGAMLPYFKQLLTNFEKVSSLVLDPKRTFVDEAYRLLKKEKPEITVRRFSLDGNETFNPVYVDRPLKNSRFIDIAEMVRASSINFGGGKNDSPFWDISAFNLIKNSIVYCAATLEYFTLKDIYSTMIRSTDQDLTLEMESARVSEKKTKRPQPQMMPLNAIA